MATALAPAEIRALARLIDELDYYQLLEVAKDAPTSAVKKAYYSHTRRFHPDRSRGLDDSTRDAAGTVAKRLAEAYAVLRDPRRRKAYDEQCGSAAAHPRIQLVEAEARTHRQGIEQTLGSTPNGRRFFALARSEIDRGNLEAANRNIKMALTFEPGNDFFRQKLSEVQEALRPAR